MNKLIKVILFLIVGMVQAFAWGGLRGDTLAKELDEAVLNRSFYLQQREQRITQLKDMFLLSKISLWQEYEINHQLYEEFKENTTRLGHLLHKAEYGDSVIYEGYGTHLYFPLTTGYALCFLRDVP